MVLNRKKNFKVGGGENDKYHCMAGGDDCDITATRMVCNLHYDGEND